jgi:SAM-dependent methyltransferase
MISTIGHHSAVMKLGEVFDAMVSRGETREKAQKFTLQCAIAIFTENKKLLPKGSFREFISNCAHGQSSSLVILPQSIGSNFSKIDPIQLSPHESSLLARAAEENWTLIPPSIFGSLYQATMSRKNRHESGAHYTPENAILEHVIRPSLIQPWRKRIQEASTVDELLEVRNRLTQLRILDPACGSGNFLYVAYQALKQLEQELRDELHERFSEETRLEVESNSAIHRRQFFGIDIDPFAVEIAKITLLLGSMSPSDSSFLVADLHENFVCADALFCAWPKADVIIGNPPFQSKNKMQKEFGADYVQRLRARYPDVPGRADYCVYWFKRTHDELGPDSTAGLVGTNTIRQNYSREGGLDYIVNNGGTITEAVSSMVWPGQAVVHVSVVNWSKGSAEGPKKLSWQEGDDRNNPWAEKTLVKIPSSLSADTDVTQAKVLETNAKAKACYQGQTHGHEGFLLSQEEARAMIAASPTNRDVIFPFLIGEDLLNNIGGKPSRWIIDFHPRDEFEAQRYELPFRRLQERVLPDRQAAAREENRRNARLSTRGNKHHASFLKRWWILSYPRREVLKSIGGISRFIACSRVTKRPIFEFVSSRIHPSDALLVFPLEDDYSFGILQSGLHWAWFKARCSTLKGDWRYTSNTVFDSFPWPQNPSEKQVAEVARAAVALRKLRKELATKHKMPLRAMYSAKNGAEKSSLEDAQADLDEAVRNAHGMNRHENVLEFLLASNRDCANREGKSERITGPGLPAGTAAKKLVTRDAIEPVEL